MSKSKKVPLSCLHLALDGYECNQGRLGQEDLIYEFLDSCPGLVNMTVTTPPYSFKYRAKVSEDWGISGFVLAAEKYVEGNQIKFRGEGYISIHIYPGRAYLSLDIFFKKEFNPKPIADYVTKLFDIGRIKENLSSSDEEPPDLVA